jgi:ribosomal protein L16/L10AE
MGKGVGAVKLYIANVKQGKILLELQTLVSKELLAMLKKLVFKLPVKCCILLRSYY